MIETTTYPKDPTFTQLKDSPATDLSIPAALEALPLRTADEAKDRIDLKEKIPPPDQTSYSDKDPIPHVMTVASKTLPPPEKKEEALKPAVGMKPPLPLGSLSTEDLGCLTDATLNPIHATFFEIGVALAILEQPGPAGLQMDAYALQLKAIIERVYETPFGDTEITFDGKTMTLRDYFNTKFLKEIHPSCDQIGRCTDLTKTDTWLTGAGKTWLCEQLSKSSTAPDYNLNNMLTKVRMINALGSASREMYSVPTNRPVLAALFNKDVAVLNERALEINTQIRHPDFDSSAARLRRERPPIIDNSPLLPNDPRLGDGGFAGPNSKLCFGMIYEPEKFSDRTLAEKYAEKERAHGRNAMPRHGQPVSDLSRPGVISEEGLKRMPQAFKNTELPEKLNTHRLYHGTGVNRWELIGTYGKQSWSSGYPSAVAHSGSASDIFLALNFLDPESLLGNREKCIKAGLLITSFMNFGGYHTFNEIFPITVSFAKREIFHVTGKRKVDYKLYEEFTKMASEFCPNARGTVLKYKKAYRESIAEAAQKKDVQEKREQKVQFGNSRTAD